MPWPPLPRRPWLLPKAISRRARPPYRLAVGAKGGIGATRRGATVGGRAAWGGEGAKLGCLATSRWPLPCWPRARGRGTVDGIGTQEREPQERVRHREGGGLRSRVLEPASVLDLLGPAVTAPIAPLILLLWIGKSVHGSARACAADRSLYGMSLHVKNPVSRAKARVVTRPQP